MICVSVQEKSFGDCRAILESCEMAELRADLCRLSVEEVERLVEIRPNLIATCRIANSSEAFAREQLAAAIRRGARYVDIEIEAPRRASGIRSYACPRVRVLADRFVPRFRGNSLPRRAEGDRPAVSHEGGRSGENRHDGLEYFGCCPYDAFV